MTPPSFITRRSVVNARIGDVEFADAELLDVEHRLVRVVLRPRAEDSGGREEGRVGDEVALVDEVGRVDLGGPPALGLEREEAASAADVEHLLAAE
ncbi:MAG: hypothetical protein K2X91_09595, partial [Thermoleophilia bacterium]|nr:hypothetical protein [Thermoleophilia bacterium]